MQLVIARGCTCHVAYPSCLFILSYLGNVQDNPGTAGMEVDAQQPAQSQNISKPAKQRAKKAGGDAGKMVIRWVSGLCY